MKLESIRFYQFIQRLESSPWNDRAAVRFEGESKDTHVSLFSYDNFKNAVGVAVNQIGYNYELLVNRPDGSEILMRFSDDDTSLRASMARLGYIEK